MDPKVSFSDLSDGSGRRGDRALKTCGRSVGKLHEEITRLRKENFHLKLVNYELEETKRRCQGTVMLPSDDSFKIKELEDELRETLRTLKVLRKESSNLKKKMSQLHDYESDNKRLTEALLEKNVLLKDAAMIISKLEDHNYKTDSFVDGVKKLTRDYDEERKRW
ncbi:uncharacterized protein [Drosophila kikkawai]|uniref:Centrosomin N-terminal motif 1 domain-containing protein n=1 Tax=Drosophila kikkawai TaxID=30033 RepID=A0A6P4I5W7_DROKI|nr:uncharacterized protein LOC108071727 [Drosophila kikkawai]KAH8303431.1 hypothetical protein KR059_010994 [Drosophila kikkawai]